MASGSQTYSDWSGKTCDDGSTAVYAGNSAGQNDAIQLRSDKSTSGIVSTTSGGKIKKVKVNWYSGTTNGRTLNIYGSNTAYTSPTELYGNNVNGTKLGTIVMGTSTELEITGDYTYIGLRSNSGAMYIVDIWITWETGGGSTTETCATPTFSPAAGSYTEAQTVTITSETEGATIYYTTDGNDPTTSSSSIANGGTVGISNSCTLKAMAVATGHNNSAVASAAYTIITDNTPADAITATFVASEDVGTNSSGAGSITKSPLTFACTSCNLSDGSVYRLYSGSTTTISAPEGYTIYKIVFTPASGYSTNLLSSTTGSYISGTGTWLGEAESVSFSASAQFRCTAITVYYTAPDVTSNIYRVIKTNGETSTAGGWLGNWSENCTLPDGATGTDYTVTADAGETIQFKAGTNAGYQILAANVSAVDADDNEVALTTVTTEGSGITFSFTMPASAVTITANFTTYRGTIRLAGRFNGNTGWRTGTSGPAFTYDSTNDKYTIDAYFTGEGDGNYFFITYDGNASYPSANGNWTVTNTTGTPTALTWDGNGHNFYIENGVFTIELAGDLSTIAFTKKEPTLTFAPTAGEVEQGTTVSATSNLTNMIAAIKAIDTDAQGDVTVGVNTDNGSTWNASETLNTVGSATVYGKAYIGNINVTGNASYTVVAANNSKTYRRTNTLTVGKKYIIVNESANVGFKTGGYEESITITDHQTTLSDGSTVIEFKLGGEEGAYTFMSGSKYLQNSSSNTVNVAADEAKTWTVTIDNTSYDATMKANATNYYLRYNSGASNNKFRAYSNSSTAAAVQIYEQVAEETKDFTITYAEVTGGSASGADGANAGETITVTVTADEGYACSGVTVTTDEPDNSPLAVTDNHDGTYTFTVPSNFNGTTITVTPSFASAYAITYVAEPAAGGTVTGVASAVYDARVEVTVTPNADYQLSGTPTYTYNGTTQQLAGAGTAENPYYFNMPGYATTVTANFVKIPHGITVTSAHGEVTGLPATATSGTEVTFTVTPNAGYVVSSVSGTFNDGNSSLSITDNGDGTYTFSMPAYDVAITVTYFASEEYELLTDLSDINEEDTYLIVGGPASGTDKVNVMGKKSDNSTMGYTALTSSNYDSTTGIITSDENMAIVNFLVSDGTYAIHTADGYVNESSVTASTPFYWTIELDETSSRAQITSTSKHFSYNNSAPRWKAYNAEQGASYIFKLANQNKVKRPTVTGAAGEFLGLYNFIGKDNVTMACATDGATIEYSLDGGTTWHPYSEAFEIATNAAGNTVEVQARATKTDMEPSDVVTATFTCIKPTAPTFGNNEAGAYVNPVFVYPKSALNDRRAYGEESVTFCYTTTGTDADASSPAVTTSNSNGYYIVLDDNATLSVVTVINGIASDPAGGEYTFSVDAPAFSLAGGAYDGDQQTRLSTNTKTQQNNLSWNTVIYYTTGNTEFAFDSATGEVTSTEWIAYDPTNNPYLNILVEDSPVTIKAVTLSNYFNGQSEYRASDVTTETYTLTAANLAITISPAAGTYVNAQNVTLGVKNNVGNYTIYYTTDGTAASASSAEYNGPITVASDMTINVYAVDSRSGEGGTATAEAVYKIGVQPVVYSPFPGTIYKGDDEDITVEMFSVTPNAKIYYTVAEGEVNYPDDPTTGSTLYSAPVPLETGKVYNFKAIAVLGSLVSSVTPGTFTVEAAGTGWPNVYEMANSSAGTSKTLDNPVQVVYMSKYRNATLPEFCFVRDNSGYGLIYFGAGNISSYSSYDFFKMGDWIEGGKIAGSMANWGESFINELGGGSSTSYRVTSWPTTSLGNTAILPEETTNKAITDGWTYEGAYSGSDYASYIDADKNLFGHYVHMRKNTITNVTGSGGGNGKHIGIITDQSGIPLNYYDGFYLFSGYNGPEDYDQTFFNNIQSKGGTFDVYAIVYFYGPNANNASYSNAPYEIFPIDFEWIYKPMFNIGTDTYHESQTISLTCDSEGAQIWYKTSEMEDWALYNGPFEVDATTTIETYSTLPSKYNDVIESVVNSITVTIGTVEPPVITEESVVKTIGETVTTDITCPTEGATIYYTTDGSDPKTSETRIEYTLGQQLTFDETTIVRAIAMQDDYYSVEAESRTYTFVKSNGIEYTLVTSASQLNENSVYVIVNKASNMAMGTNQKTSNRDAAGVMFKNADKTIVYGNDDLAQFTLKKTGNNWYLQTNNSSTNGYLSVGDGNTLLTQATADGNAEATITIDDNNSDVDKAYESHISFIYNNETTRYMRYWNRDHLFNTYTTENNAPVFLYYIEATPLATIEKEGTPDKQYTIADELVAVYYTTETIDEVEYAQLWCKDQGNVSIVKTERGDNQIDYMEGQYKAATGNDAPEEWDQSNWVVLRFTPSTSNLSSVVNAVGQYIKPASITGTYTDDVNYTITMPEGEGLDAGFLGGTAEYTENLFCTSNFLTANLNINGGQGAQGNNHGQTAYFYFVNPKIQEVCEVTFAVWNGSYFVVPAAQEGSTINEGGLSGAFNVGWKYNAGGDVHNDLDQTKAYKFRAIVQVPVSGTTTNSIRPKTETTATPATGIDPDGAYIVYPLDLDPTSEDNIVTAISNIVAGSSEVKSVKYVNVAGVVSDKPFSGVNIVVTEYTDGSRTTSKMLRK